jgi:putative transposase
MRYPVFAQEHRRQLCIDAIDWICARHKIELFTKEVMSEHVHLFIACHPDFSVRKLVQILKGGTSYYIRKNHSALKKYLRLWSGGYMFRSIGSVNAETVKNYIEKSNKWFSGKNQKTLI